VRDSCGTSRSRETPQARMRRGGSRTAPRKASACRGNQQLLLTQHSFKKEKRNLAFLFFVARDKIIANDIQKKL
jgi:hypothetical protein